MLEKNLDRARSDLNKDIRLIDEIKKEFDALDAVESDLLNRIKENDDIFEETMCPSSIANFLNCNPSKKLSEILPRRSDEELKNKVFSYYKETFKKPTSNHAQAMLNDFLADISENEIKKLNDTEKIMSSEKYFIG